MCHSQVWRLIQICIPSMMTNIECAHENNGSSRLFSEDEININIFWKYIHQGYAWAVASVYTTHLIHIDNCRGIRRSISLLFTFGF